MDARETLRHASEPDAAGTTMVGPVAPPAKRAAVAADAAVTSAVVVQTLPAVADAYVRDGSFAGNNYGSSAELITKKASVDYNRESFIRFDIAAAGPNVTSAKLRLFGKLQDTRQANVVTDVHGAPDTWQESSLTWNNRPAASTAKLSSQTVGGTTGQWYEFDVTSFVQSQKSAGAALVNLVLRNSVTSQPYSAFNSRQAATNRPELVVTSDGDGGLPVVGIAATDAGASEPGSDTGTFTLTRDGDASAPLAVNVTVGGAATEGTDYAALPDVVTFPAGASSVQITVTPQDDAGVEGAEDVVLTIAASSSSTYAIDSAAASATVVIADDDTVAPAASVTLAPTADTYVRDGSFAGSNFGTAGDLVVKKSGTNYNREGLLKFNLSTVSGAIVSATLRLFGRLENTSGTNVVTDVYGTTSTWTETGATWNNRPAATTARLASRTVQNATARWYEFDVTSYVNAERAGGRNTMSLLLRNPARAAPSTIFSSRQASTVANRPQLVLSTDAPPSPPPSGQSPFNGTAPILPALVQAEDFDNGGEAVAYHDSDAVNVTGAYRTGVGVDIEPTADTGGGFNLGHVKAGEWLEYTLDVPAAGTYLAEVRVASANPGGTFHLEFNGVNKTGALDLPYTGGWQDWQTVAKTVTLDAGTQVMRLSIDTSSGGGDVGNVNWVRLSKPAAGITWSEVASAPFAREEAQGVAHGGKLFVFGGLFSNDFLATDRIDVYDPATNLWSTRRAMPEKLTHAATVVDGNTAWFVGGYVGNHPGPATNHVWKYDLVNDAWSRGPDLPAERGAGGVALLGRRLHFFGGMERTRTIDKGEHWSLDLDTAGAAWQARAALPDPRNHLGGIALGGKAYAIGGQRGQEADSVNTDFVDAYDPAADAWTRVAALPSPRSHFNAATFVLNGRITLVAGEVTHNEAAADVWEYDPAQNRWAVSTPLPQPRRALVANVIDGEIIATGGYLAGPQLTTTWRGTPAGG